MKASDFSIPLVIGVGFGVLIYAVVVEVRGVRKAIKELPPSLVKALTGRV